MTPLAVAAPPRGVPSLRARPRRPRATTPSCAAITVDVSSHASDVAGAAACRALSFSENVPSDRSAFARRAHVAMKIANETSSLTNKLLGAEVGYESVKVVLIVARAPASSSAYDVRALDPASLSVRDGEATSLIIGSLDINIADRLPAEELAGARDSGRRAYLSNVGVVPRARRVGVASRMIERASAIARDAHGVDSLYVHVRRDNDAAIALYARAGFVLEAAETAAAASALGRPARALLRRDVRRASSSRAS